MKPNLSEMLKKNDVVAVAVSGGSDSMALLHYLFKNADALSITVKALNVEHGIRGESSIKDSEFVKKYCFDNGIPLLSYSVDSLKKAEKDKLSVEQSARILRYECFDDALNKGECTKIATAHHKRDNAESVLFNLFRGTGLKGVAGIVTNFSGKIIRPLLSVDKEEILSYVNENGIPFVTDETNSCTEYSRNFIRLNLLPKISEIFPQAENNILRFSAIARKEDEFLDKIANSSIHFDKNSIRIPVITDEAIFLRAVIIALKKTGVEKDWESVHAEAVFSLTKKKNGAMVNLMSGIVAVKEYDDVVIYRQIPQEEREIPYSIAINGAVTLGKTTVKLIPTEKPNDLKSGLYVDSDKIPPSSVIRMRKHGDYIVKFGGGKKSLGDYFTDNKVPLKDRNNIPLLCDGNSVLAIFGKVVSENVKIDEQTKKILKVESIEK